MAEPDADHFLDTYGTCGADRCACIRPAVPWLGRLCPNWRPLGVTSYAGLGRITMGTIDDKGVWRDTEGNVVLDAPDPLSFAKPRKPL